MDTSNEFLATEPVDIVLDREPSQAALSSVGGVVFKVKQKQERQGLGAFIHASESFSSGNGPRQADCRGQTEDGGYYFLPQNLQNFFATIAQQSGTLRRPRYNILGVLGTGSQGIA